MLVRDVPVMFVSVHYICQLYALLGSIYIHFMLFMFYAHHALYSHVRPLVPCALAYSFIGSLRPDHIRGACVACSRYVISWTQQVPLRSTSVE